ncbi:MAG: winged helix-turn-helix domain-containing protein [Coriobacteriales bacterium]
MTSRQTLARRVKSIVDEMEAEAIFSKKSLGDIVNGHLDDDYSLIISDASEEELNALSRLEGELSDEGEFSLLLIVDEDMLPTLRLPVQFTSDFVCRDASDEEYSARIRHLLWPGEEGNANEFIRQGPLTLNLATYQVKINGEPVDFTYLEYALLAFLITHPGRTYSRDALLNRVWDFDYYGGSRTVDVHVRRIRAKLGPDLAQHLKTVRGVGYLWSY